MKADFQMIRDTTTINNNSLNSGTTMSVRVMFGDRCLGQGPPSIGNKNAAARLAAQAVLANGEKELLNLFSKR